MADVELYGITNCDQVKRARSWLKEHQIAYSFHDFKSEPPSAELIEGWLKHVAWDTLINRRGTTWRALDLSERPTDPKSALAAAQAKPSLIKRPVLMTRGQISVGFDDANYQHLFG
jgi:arsenate reductase